MYELQFTLRSQALYFGPYASTIEAMADAYLLLNPSDETIGLFGASPRSLAFDVSISDDRGDVVMFARHAVGAELQWHRDLTQTEWLSIEIAVLSREQEALLLSPDASTSPRVRPLRHSAAMSVAA